MHAQFARVCVNIVARKERQQLKERRNEIVI